MFGLQRRHIFTLGLIGLFFALSVTPSFATEEFLLFQKLRTTVNRMMLVALQRIPALAIPKAKVYAQVAGNGGANSNVLITYYQEHTTAAGVVTGGSQASCPSGWTQMFNGYGPHYIGLIINDWVQYGVEGSGGFDWWTPPPPDGIPPTGRDPQDPPPPDDPPPPPPPGDDDPPPPPDNPPPQDPPAEPTPEPPGPDNITPGPDPYEKDTSPPVPGPGKGPEDLPYRLEQGNSIANLFKGAISTASAQSLQRIITRGVVIGSDSVCSKSVRTVVPTNTIYNNGIQPSRVRLYSEACFVDPTTNDTYCNRCYICYK